MSKIPEAELARIEAMRKKLAKRKSERSDDITFAATKLLNSGGYEAFEVRLSNSKPGGDEADKYERGYYGTHYGRAWTSGEVAMIQGSGIFQKVQKSLMPIITTGQDGRQVATPNPNAELLKPEDYDDFALFKANMIQRTFDPQMKITVALIMQDQLYLNFHWLRLMEESGLGSNMEKDLKEYFREREHVRFAVLDKRKTRNDELTIRKPA